MKCFYPLLMITTLGLMPGCGHRQDQAAPAPVPAAPVQAGHGAASPAPAMAPAVAPPAAAVAEQPHKEAVVVVKETQKAKWKAIKVSISNSLTGQETFQTVPSGKDVALGGTGVSMKVESILSDFTMGDQVIQAGSDTMRNPAAQVVLSEGGKPVWKGWVFKLFPDNRKYNQGKYSIKLVELVAGR